MKINKHVTRAFVLADPHLGHAGVCHFTRNNGLKLRPWTDPDKMTEDMIEYWNDTVTVNDKTYVLGDTVINRRFLKCLGRLKGEKVLVKGNHDIFRMQEYAAFFKDIRAYHIINNYVLSHIPIHPGSKGRFRGNIHGHLHYQSVMSMTEPKEIDPWYLCVSVEHTNYRPILLDEAFRRIEAQQSGVRIDYAASSHSFDDIHNHP